MEEIINAFDGIYNLFLKKERLDRELQSELESLSDFTITDIQRLLNLISLKVKEVEDFFEHGYLSDEQYSRALNALYKMEEQINVTETLI